MKQLAYIDMKQITYIEREQITPFKCRDTKRTVFYVSSFESGGLTYLKTDSFNYKVIPTDMILENYLKRHATI